MVTRPSFLNPLIHKIKYSNDALSYPKPLGFMENAESGSSATVLISKPAKLQVAPKNKVRVRHLMGYEQYHLFSYPITQHTEQPTPGNVCHLKAHAIGIFVDLDCLCLEGWPKDVAL